MKRYDEMTEQEQNALSDGMKEIAKIKMHQNACHQDLSELYKVKNWLSSHHDAQQTLYRLQDTLAKQLETAIWNEIKNCTGCIHLELATLKREKDKNNISSQVAIKNIEHFADQITEITQ